MRTLRGIILVGTVALAMQDAAAQVRLDVDSTATCERVSAVEGREPSLLPEGKKKKFKLVWSDEFDGDRLDESKWGYRTNFWGQPAYWFATPEDGAVDVKDGLLHLKLVKRADGQFVSPQLQTGDEFLVDYVRVYDRNRMRILCGARHGRYSSWPLTWAFFSWYHTRIVQ